MNKGTLFWVLMILWLIFGIIGAFSAWPAAGAGLVVYVPLASSLLLWVLLGLLGWQVFGPAVR